MKSILVSIGILVSLLAGEAPVAAPPVQTPVRVLIITGHDVPAHDWRTVTPILRSHLELTGRFEVFVSEEPLVLESKAALEKYDVILMNYYNAQLPSITEQARENLLAFVRGGKGLVSFHFTCRAFQDWPEFRNLIGRIWTTGSGHGPRGKFTVKVKNPDHFITQGLSDFEADDELYSKLVGDAKINVLVEAYSDWSKQTEPIAWTLDYGRGRVFNYVLGHDAAACRNPNFARLLQRGTEWAAGK